MKPSPVADPKDRRVPTDGRRTLMLYMDAALIKDLKKIALDDDRNVYEDRSIFKLCCFG
jgi:hypothetical protein